MFDPVHEQLTTLSEETISPAYLTDRATYEAYAARNDRTLLACYADGVDQPIVEVAPEDLDRTDWDVLGVALLGRYDRAGLGEAVAVPVERVLASTPLCEADFPVSFVKLLAVRPDQQGRGLGTRISTDAAARVIAEPPAATMAWLRDNPANRKIAASYSDFVMARFDDYFPDDWACPECGFGNDCDCAVEMYGWFTDDRAALTGSVDASRAAAPSDD
jgi:GNAT superfamily N-acetyltransferase